MLHAYIQYSEKVNVSDGIENSYILGPYFSFLFTGYLDSLQKFLFPKLRIHFQDDDNSNKIDRNIWYQQDGCATPHVELEVRTYY